MAPEVIFHAHAFREAPGDALQQSDHLVVETIIIAKQHFHAGGGGTGDENLACRGFDRQDIIFILQQHDGFGCGPIGQLTMFVTSHHIHRNGCKRYFFGWIEHAKFEACAERACQGAIDICFGDESALDRFGNLVVDMITAHDRSHASEPAPQSRRRPL